MAKGTAAAGLYGAVLSAAFVASLSLRDCVSVKVMSKPGGLNRFVSSSCRGMDDVCTQKLVQHASMDV